MTNHTHLFLVSEISTFFPHTFLYHGYVLLSSVVMLHGGFNTHVHRISSSFDLRTNQRLSVGVADGLSPHRPTVAARGDIALTVSQ